MTNDIKDNDLVSDESTVSAEPHDSYDEAQDNTDLRDDDFDNDVFEDDYTDSGFEDDFDSDFDDDFHDDFDGDFDDGLGGGSGDDSVVKEAGFDVSGFLKKNFHYIAIALIALVGVWFVLSSLGAPVNGNNGANQNVSTQNLDAQNTTAVSPFSDTRSSSEVGMGSITSVADSKGEALESSDTPSSLGSLLGGAKPELKSPSAPVDSGSLVQTTSQTPKNIDPQTWVQTDNAQNIATTPPMPSPISRDNMPVFPTVTVDKEIKATGALAAAGLSFDNTDKIDNVPLSNAVNITDNSMPDTKDMASDSSAAVFDAEVFRGDIVRDITTDITADITAQIDEKLSTKDADFSNALTSLTDTIKALQAQQEKTSQMMADLMSAQDATKDDIAVVSSNIDQKAIVEATVSSLTSKIDARFNGVSNRLDSLEKTQKDQRSDIVKAMNRIESAMVVEPVQAEVRSIEALPIKAAIEGPRKINKNKPVREKVSNVSVPPAAMPVSITSVVKKPSYRTVEKAAPAVKSTPSGWVLRAAQPNVAWVSETMQSPIEKVTIGDVLPNIGRISSITNGSNGWVVQGSMGIIEQ